MYSHKAKTSVSGGLSCAISCLKEGLDVLILEKAHEFSEIGAVIQMPPNATRIMKYYGLIEKLENEGGAVMCDKYNALRYSDGSQIVSRPPVSREEWHEEKFGAPWYVLHRADYHRILVDEAARLGAQMRLGCDVVHTECSDRSPCVRLSTGEEIVADVVVGADGLRSVGAAVAVEDAAVLGKLLGLLSREENWQSSVPATLQLFEQVRKQRTTLNVQGAIENRHLYQMVDVEECEQRDQLLRQIDWDDEKGDCRWCWASMRYLKDLLGFDAIESAEEAFAEQFNLDTS
ncbi:hypothetical protein B0A49_05472 [Cryomyces minteri]|uniref:FAD-binding domain-containing protein n=1 Tax=Cryomyces minteri TaxID=331657 RepID=A0A4U0WVZ7_9PEZI|nr:hypothetical protein B0A49_05472 [Cryomyces minteri]